MFPQMVARRQVHLLEPTRRKCVLRYANSEEVYALDINLP